MRIHGYSLCRSSREPERELRHREARHPERPGDGLGRLWERPERPLAGRVANPLETGLRGEGAKEEEPEAREAKGEEGEPAALTGAP